MEREIKETVSTNRENRAGNEVDVSIGIAHRNNYALLRNCVRSIYDSLTTVRVEIIIIDNASVDGSADAVASEFPGVRVIRNEAPRGYGATNNQAFWASTGRYFLVLNNDTLFAPGVLETLTAYMDHDASIGCMGCRVTNEDGSLQHSCFRRVSLANQIFHDLVPGNLILPASRFRSRMFDWDHSSDRDVRVIMGAFMLFPRHVFEKVQGFDENFEFFVEEFDICERVHGAGYRVVFTPSATITHLGGQSMKAEPIRNYLVFQQSRERYFRKHEAAWKAWILRITAFVGMGVRLLGWAMAGILVKHRRNQAREMVTLYRRVLPKLFPLSRTWKETATLPSTER